jgi:Membrane-associated phospholipid phosphatase
MIKLLLFLFLFICSFTVYSQAYNKTDTLLIADIRNSRQDLYPPECINPLQPELNNAREDNNKLSDSASNNCSFSNAYTKPKFLITSAIVAAGLFATDNETYTILHNYKIKHSFVNDISPVITEMGDGKFSLALFGGLFLHYCLFNNHKSLETAKIGIESFLLSGIAVQFSKQLFGRERPSNATQKGGKFHGPFSFFSNKSNDIASYDSFPSGHTTTAFSWASTLAEMYPDGAVPYISYSLASLIALSRITERTHWASDCFVGAIMGIVSTKLVIYLNKINSYGTVNPFVSQNFIGAQYSLNF